MGVILDTSVIIAAERGTFDLTGYLASLGNESVSIAAITASELLHGVLRAKGAGVRAARAQFVESVLSNVPVLPFGVAEARVHASIWAFLAEKGRLIGAHDLLIAATALAYDGGVATLNREEFRRVPKLTLAALDPFEIKTSGTAPSGTAPSGTTPPRSPRT